MRKKLLLILATVTLVLSACASETSKSTTDNSKESTTKIVNLGIQQTLSPLWVAKEKGWLEEAFAEIGVEVVWTEFQSGPPQFEGIAAGKLDITEVGNTPPISAQAANIQFKEVALLSEGKTNNAILIPENSPIQSVADLEGKKVAVAKGSSAFGLLYAAFKKEGVDPTTVEIIQLQPDEAQPAFENRSVDAWATWEPFVSNQTVGHNAKILVNVEDAGSYSPMYTIARTGLIEENPELLEVYLDVYQKAAKWVSENPEETTQFFADLKSLDIKIVESVLANTPYNIQVISPTFVDSQQEIADLLYDQGVITKKINTNDVVDNQFIEKILKGGE